MASWTEKLNQMTQNAISKSKEVAGVTKLNLEISTLNQNIKNIQTEVGAYVLENGLLKEDASVVEWASKVASLKAEIEANSEKIHDLKNISICPGCGAEVSRTSKFCDKCGTPIVVASTDPVKEEEIIDAQYSETSGEAAAEEVKPEACGADEAEKAGCCCESQETPAED